MGKVIAVCTSERKGLQKSDVKSAHFTTEWGIDGGRISKLTLKRDGKEVCNYDRGWDIEPEDENTQLALEILLHGEN